MKLSLFISSAVFATAILATPKGRRGLVDRVQRRATRTTHLSAPVKLLYNGDVTKGANDTNVQYSDNWAGAVLTAPPSGQTFSAVSGQFTVPTPSAPGGGDGSSSYSASIWVGIDGDTYGNAILQAGVDVTANSDGSQSYDSWYEWYPDYAHDFSTDQFSFTAGDVISIAISSSSDSSGQAVLENLSNGQSVTQQLSAPSGSAVLGGQNAEWIVEDYESGNSLVSFADFGTVDFSNCVASTGSQSVGTDGATIIEIQDSNGNTLTDVSIPSSSDVQVVYQ